MRVLSKLIAGVVLLIAAAACTPASGAPPDPTPTSTKPTHVKTTRTAEVKPAGGHCASPGARTGAQLPAFADVLADTGDAVPVRC